jgi:hypothetical protein
MGQVWIAVEIKHETEAAILVDHGMGEDTWVPKSQILDYSEDSYCIGDAIEIELPEWLANEKGMI